MQKRRLVVSMAVACACLMMLGGLAVACSPQNTSTSLALAGSQSSPQATPIPKVSAGQGTPPGRDIIQSITHAAGFSDLIPWQKISQGIQALGFGTYPNLYEQGEDTGHHSVILYLGPGDDTAFLRDLHAFLDSPTIKATGITPTITIVRVRTSPAGFAATRDAMLAATARLSAAGFVSSSWGPNLHTGTYDVALSAAPKGMSAAAATAYLRKTVSPLIRVTTVHAAPVEMY